MMIEGWRERERKQNRENNNNKKKSRIRQWMEGEFKLQFELYSAMVKRRDVAKEV